MPDFMSEQLKFEHRLEGLIQTVGEDVTATLQDALEDVQGRILLLGAKAEETPSLLRRKEYLEKQRAEIGRVLGEIYADMEKQIRDRSAEVAKEVPEIVHRINEATLPERITVQLGVPTLSRNQVFAWWESFEVDGLLFRRWMEKAEQNAVDLVVKEAKRSLIFAEKPAQAAKRIASAMSITRQSADRLLYDAMQSARSWGERVYMEKNEELITGYRYHVEFDARTCELCAPLDQTVWTEVGEVVWPPLHSRCRCHIFPIYLNVDYLDRRIARHERPRLVHHKDGTTSTDWSQLEDVQFVPGKTSYMDWLGSLVDSENPAHVRTAREILGATRFNLVKDGKIEIEKLYYNGKIKSVNELRELM